MSLSSPVRLVLAASLAAQLACSSTAPSVSDGGDGGGDGGGGGAGGGGAGGGGAGGGGAGGGGAGGGGGGGGSASCLAGRLAAGLGKDSLLVGVSTNDTVAAQAPFDVRYLYLAGDLFDGAAPCASCATGCTAAGTACTNAGGCNWWGCWQWDQDPPGKYVRDLVRKAQTAGQVPMITYYVLLALSGYSEGAPEVTTANSVPKMTRYYADWRFMLEQLGPNTTAFIHIEPDFWGYAQQVNSNPHLVPAAVASANPTDCSGLEASISGMSRCMIRMVRKYAPKAKVGLHGSGWATGVDVLLNRSSSTDVAAEATKLGTYLLELGAAEGDFIVVDASDRDAGYYQSQGRNTWWDTSNSTLPHFHQAFHWAKVLAEKVDRPIVWWQLPLGNLGLNDTPQRWKDNRVDYLFSHTAEVVNAHGALIAFGAGAGTQTSPATDNGNLVAKTNAHAAARQKACP